MENHPSAQEQYLADIRQIIKDNIDNESFSVADLASEVGLSRSMLHRKLIRLTGKSATDLITEIRLTKAYELLENDTGTVSEIAYRVGYSNPSYFNKVFKKTYKVSAGDVRKKGSGKVSHLRVIKEPGTPDSGRSKRSASKVIAGTNILMIGIVTLGALALILGLMDNISPFSKLPGWITDLVLVILIIGLISAIVLYWIYDIHQKGFSRIKSIDESGELGKPSTSNKRRLRFSDAIIVVLILLVGILAYPRIFGSEDVRTMAYRVHFVNEFGERETRWVFKEDYVTRLALFPFENETTDSTLDWMGWGIMEAVFEDQRQFPNMMVDKGGIPLLHDQITAARNAKYPYFLTGSYRVGRSVYEITTRLYQTSNGGVQDEHVFRGSDFFSLLDSIGSQVRSDLGISESILETTTDLPVSTLVTNHLGAYEYYILGRFWMESGTDAYSNLSSAIQLDSTFALAYYRLAHSCYFFQTSHLSAVNSIHQAISYRSRLSERSDNETRILNCMIKEDRESMIILSDILVKSNPLDFSLLVNLLHDYLKLGLTDRAEELGMKLNAMVPDHPPYQIWLARTYLISGKPDKARKVLNKLLAENPVHPEAMLILGQTFLHNHKLEAAEETFRKAILLMPEHEEQWSYFLAHIVFLREAENYQEVLEPLTNTRRVGEWVDQAFTIRSQLFIKPNHQAGLFYYPVSDSVVFAAFEDDFIKASTVFSKQGKPVRTYSRQLSIQDREDLDVWCYWIEDSLILRAKDLLAAGLPQDALTAFIKAYEENPEHYYLANYIQHLQWITSPEYDAMKSVYKAYVGSYEVPEDSAGTSGDSYGVLKFEIQQDRFYQRNKEGLVYELLPLSEDAFMVPSAYDLTIRIVKENGVVRGLKYLYRDGREALYQRIQEVPITQLIN